MGERAADLAGADQCDLRSGHPRLSRSGVRTGLWLAPRPAALARAGAPGVAMRPGAIRRRCRASPADARPAPSAGRRRRGTTCRRGGSSGSSRSRSPRTSRPRPRRRRGAGRSSERLAELLRELLHHARRSAQAAGLLGVRAGVAARRPRRSRRGREGRVAARSCSFCRSGRARSPRVHGGKSPEPNANLTLTMRAPRSDPATTRWPHRNGSFGNCLPLRDPGAEGHRERQETPFLPIRAVPGGRGGPARAPLGAARSRRRVARAQGRRSCGLCGPEPAHAGERRLKAPIPRRWPCGR